MIMEKLADISAFTNLMNQNNSMLVHNGFKDKAKRALISGLIGSSLLGVVITQDTKQGKHRYIKRVTTQDLLSGKRT